MAYQYTEFDGVALPLYNGRQSHDVAPVETALLDSIGGVVDYYATTRRLGRRNLISVEGVYVGEIAYLVDEAGNYLVDEAGNNLIAGLAANRLRAQVEALRSKVGVRGTLYRRHWDDSTLEWITARLLRVKLPRRVELHTVLAEITAEFETEMVAWRAATPSAPNVAAADGVETFLYVSNVGVLPVQDAVITIACTSGTITQVDIDGANLGIDLVWTGSLASGKTLTIDCGAQTVQLDGVDSYAGFGLGGGHTVQGWLPLEPGLTSLSVLTTNGVATITVTFYPQAA